MDRTNLSDYERIDPIADGHGSIVGNIDDRPYTAHHHLLVGSYEFLFNVCIRDSEVGQLCPILIFGRIEPYGYLIDDLVRACFTNTCLDEVCFFGCNVMVMENTLDVLYAFVDTRFIIGTASISKQVFEYKDRYVSTAFNGTNDVLTDHIALEFIQEFFIEFYHSEL